MYLAMAENPNIATLQLINVLEFPRCFSNILRRTLTIKKLFVTFFERNARPRNETVNDFANALEQNQSLEEVILFGPRGREDSMEMAYRVMLALNDIPTLQKLTMYYFYDADRQWCTAMVDMLRSNQTLQHLELSGYTLDEDEMRAFLSSLRSNSSLGTLVLEYTVASDVGAVDQWVEFVQKHCNRESSALSELSLVHDSQCTMFPESTTGRVAANMVLGSALERLVLVEFLPRANNLVPLDYGVFFETLIGNMSAVSLRSLKVDHVVGDAAEAMLRFLVLTTTLMDLTVMFLGADVSQTELCSAVRRNGSLHTVLIEVWDPRSGAVPLEDATTLRLNRYCQRNRETRDLLTQPGEHDALQPGQTNVPLFPGLFTTSRLAERTLPNTMLIGVQAEAIGPSLP